jgi:large subunit ribosomal protein L23
MHTFNLKPLVTEKSLMQAADGVYNFVVPTDTTKQSIKKQVEMAFGVNVANVRTATTSRAAVTFRRKSGMQSAWKKAIVTLSKGQTIADFSLPAEAEQPMTNPEQEPTQAKEEKTTSSVTVRSKSKTKKQEVANG